MQIKIDQFLFSTRLLIKQSIQLDYCSLELEVFLSYYLNKQCKFKHFYWTKQNRKKNILYSKQNTHFINIYLYNNEYYNIICFPKETIPIINWDRFLDIFHDKSRPDKPESFWFIMKANLWKEGRCIHLLWLDKWIKSMICSDIFSIFNSWTYFNNRNSYTSQEMFLFWIINIESQYLQYFESYLS